MNQMILTLKLWRGFYCIGAIESPLWIPTPMIKSPSTRQKNVAAGRFNHQFMKIKLAFKMVVSGTGETGSHQG